ncbi:DHHC-type zinc finger family protein isoform X2 [Tasmannia lanceolata]|uniref:DHHC-type zinc finger family protein isoform X2 n=1 Tax=Tasmannia lanceolata TaxID=3420 RepID=UPI004063F671
MTMVGFCRPSEQVSQRCFQIFPCLSDPVRRSSWGLKVALVALHLIFVGALFLFDRDLIYKTRKEPWYTAIYLVLFAATLIQYFVTSGSSPGYVLDAMRAGNESQATFREATKTSKQSASSKNGNMITPLEGQQPGRNIPGTNTTSWVKLVMDMYPHGSSSRNWTCTYCNVVQPPRSKHCHDCDKCVLQFDHHCVWLGTCIGQGNHCRFWWKDAVVILLLAILCISLIFLLLLLLFHSYLVLTNQTTYELVRRRRITYLRGVPDRVYPFSRGICRNIYNFCCSRSSVYTIEPLPTADELEAKAKPYTFLDVISCRCC